MFLVLPQLVAATILGPLVRNVFGGQAILALCLAAGALALAAASTFLIPAPREGRAA
jgi:maltose/moltooligosaccharide transporter